MACPVTQAKEVAEVAQVYRKEPTTIAVANAKGGAGKTTVAVHLAAGLARAGQRTLLVDLDSQANATGWLLPPLPSSAPGIADALVRGLELDKVLLEAPDRPGLWVAPATPALAGADLALAGEVGGETLLAKALAPMADRFDVVVLDCPPNLGLSVVSALYAARWLLAPVPPSFLALAGLRRLEDTLARIRERLNARTDVLGYVLFDVDAREAISAEARELLERQAAGRLLKAEVRTSAAAKALPAHRLTAWDAGADARGLEDYTALLAEVQQRLSGEKRKGRA
jgi:chromosome partitioning protein